MGQKTEFHLEDWTFPEEESQTQELSTTDLMTELEEDFNLLDENAESSVGIDEESLEVKPVIEIMGTKFNTSGIGSDHRELTQEEDAFKKQIEDLFELLELEKKSNQSDGIRVYQTDSSPSRPWRFH